jgi:hypothetical protein
MAPQSVNRLWTEELAMSSQHAVVPIGIAIKGNKHFKLRADEYNHLRETYASEFLLLNTPTPHSPETDSAGQSEDVAVTIVIYSALAYFIYKFFEGFLNEAGADAYKAIKRFSVNKIEGAGQGGNAKESDKFREFLAHIVARNEAKSYRAEQSINIVLELNDEHVKFKINIADSDFMHHREYGPMREKFDKRISDGRISDNFFGDKYHKYIDEFSEELRPIARKIVDDVFSEIYGNIDQILFDIEKFNIGKITPGDLSQGGSSTGFHVISRRGPKGNKVVWSIEAEVDDFWHGPRR